MSPLEPAGDTASLRKEARNAVFKKAISAPRFLNEPYDYPRPSSFSRGIRLDIKGVTVLLISGTASVDENGLTVHPGDFRAQTWRTYKNITGLLEAEGATWKDVVRTTNYLRDIERDYPAFNDIRTQFFKEQCLNPLPASTGIQAILCRPDLLIEIEAMAIFESERKASYSPEREKISAGASLTGFSDGGSRAERLPDGARMASEPEKKGLP